MSVGEAMNIFKRLYNYRELLKTNIKKDIRGKYKGSILGVLWSFVNPLLMVLVYAIVFPLILKSPEKNYWIFLVVGIIPWNFFTTVVSQGTTSVLVNANIIKKVYFPREILPISVATSGLVNFSISCLIIFAIVIGSGLGLSWYVLLLPLMMIIQYFLQLGIVFILSALNVYIRDVEYITNFVVMMLFYGTPILYSIHTIAEAQRFKTLLNLNPMTHIINGYRDIFYYQQLPDLKMLALVGIFSIALTLVGYWIFKKMSRGFVEEV